MNIRLAGFGGQGIIMAGYALGHAGVLDGRNALQTQSYGSESRGGACKSDVIISEGEILELAPSALDALVAMSQPALDRFVANLKPDGILIYDSDLVKPGDALAKPDGSGIRAFGLPATNIAHQTFGRDVVANVIMLGCLAALTGVVSHDSLRKAISQSVPAKTVDMNLEAFEEGFGSGAGGKGE
ncbi:MAG: 2-oxoacid:acceptor oxidoreductase family protein [Phycisphaerae bacterium]|nr:2-oxoacid:acceptor oxidoreductase family protein [Phycisphaerae bacterium]